MLEVLANATRNKRYTDWEETELSLHRWHHSVKKSKGRDKKEKKKRSLPKITYVSTQKLKYFGINQCTRSKWRKLHNSDERHQRSKQMEKYSIYIGWKT